MNYVMLPEILSVLSIKTENYFERAVLTKIRLVD